MCRPFLSLFATILKYEEETERETKLFSAGNQSLCVIFISKGKPKGAASEDPSSSSP